MLGLFGLVIVVVVSVVAVHGYMYSYDTTKKVTKQMESVQSEVQSTADKLKTENRLMMDAAKTESTANWINARKEATAKISEESSTLRNELNTTSKSLNQMIVGYVTDILSSIGLLRADQKATWNDYTATKADYNATKTDYLNTKKAYQATQQSLAETKADYEVTKKDYLSTKDMLASTRNDMVGLSKDYQATKALLTTMGDSGLKDQISKELNTQNVITANMTVKNTMTTAGLTSTNGDVTVTNGKLRVGRTQTDKWPQGWGLGLHSWDVYANGTVGAGKDGMVNAYLNSEGAMYGKTLNATDTVTTKDAILSGKLTAGSGADIKGDVNVTGTLKVNGQAITGQGSTQTVSGTQGPPGPIPQDPSFNSVAANDVDLKGTLFFGKNDGSTDPYSLRKVTNGDNSSLRFTINDNPDESIEIWGDSCAAGNCAGEGKLKHKFTATGDAQHEGNLSVKGKLTVNGQEVKAGGSTQSAIGPDPRFDSVGRDSGDWFRIYGTKDNGTAMYNGVSINDGGLAVGQWGKPGHGGIAVNGKNVVEFGTGIGKQGDAGKLGYQTFSDGLDIIGAGTDATSRKITMWDNVFVQKDLQAANVSTSDVDLKGTLFFGKNDGSTDPYSLRKVTNGVNNSSLRMTINDDADEAFEIWGSSCATGNCAGEGTLKHKFLASGDVQHEGNLAVFDKQILLRGLNDPNHYMRYEGGTVDGPRIQGFNGGQLGTRDNRTQLSWDYNGVKVADKFCIGSTCITEANLKKLL